MEIHFIYFVFFINFIMILLFIEKHLSAIYWMPSVKFLF